MALSRAFLTFLRISPYREQPPERSGTQRTVQRRRQKAHAVYRAHLHALEDGTADAVLDRARFDVARRVDAISTHGRDDRSGNDPRDLDRESYTRNNAK